MAADRAQSNVETGQHLEEEPSQNALNFQEMIRSRKEEVKAKTEEKRRETVKELEKRKLRNEKESEDKICGLPNEVWEIVLSYVSTPQDVGSMWEAFPKFRALTNESQSKECLLSKLLSIDHLPFLWDKWNIDFNKFDMLKKLRSVSKGMRNAVDRWAEEYFLKTIRSSGPLYPDWNIGRLKDMRSVDRVLAKFCDGPVESRAERVFRPSISLYFSEWNREVFQELRQKMTTLLEIVGDQIWHFQFKAHIHHHWQDKNGSKALAELTDCYLLVQELMGFTPNLKWLEVDISCGWGMKGSPIPEDVFQNYPFPHLKHLERIKFGDLDFNMGQQKFQIANAVITPNSHVRMLDVDVAVSDGRDQEVTEWFKSLTSRLNLDALTLSDNWDSNALPIIQPLIASKNCFLKRLEFHFHRMLPIPLGGAPLEPMFNLLNNFPALEHLSMNISPVAVGNNLPALKLPNLTHFEFNASIGIWDGVINPSVAESLAFLFSLNFLLQSKKLKTIVWSAKLSPRKLQGRLRRLLINHERHEEMVNFRGSLRDLTYSNVWDVFPELKTVKVLRPDIAYISPWEDPYCQVRRNTSEVDAPQTFMAVKVIPGRGGLEYEPFSLPFKY